jgi:outer membrane protein
MKYNNEISIEQLHTRILESKVSVESSKFLPSVDAKGSIGRLTSDTNPDLGQPGWSAEVVLTVPIFDGMSTLRNRDSAVHLLSSQQLVANYTERKVRQEIKDVISHFTSLDTRLSVEDIAVQKSAELLKAIKLEYKRGIRDSSSLASATETLMTTQLKSLDLKRDWYNTRVKLLTLTGEVVDPKMMQ